MCEALGAVGGGDARLLGVGGATLERSRAANLAVLGAPTLPAWQRYTGVVWDHFDVGSLAAPDRRRAVESVVVVSALAGLSALDDPLPDHRLKLSVSLDGLGALARWWRPRLSAVLDRHLRGRTVIDLLPNEHAAAWEPSGRGYEHLRVRFVGRDGRVAGHTAKAAKGLLARALVGAGDPRRTVERWEHPDLSVEIVASG